ncbi:hypothetical protein FA95DRAFT_1562989 [Auriscalpium vulgare]|uniref:Uncharacterized protein n=1 Tax=Auriscalpium vulgare TaxID=40419 RepID=A0ACB8RIL3_9AGAM|nr:hypothetical protein FA95DRAFT_1562989 [Auriscalpium vulgare]
MSSCGSDRTKTTPERRPSRPKDFNCVDYSLRRRVSSTPSALPGCADRSFPLGAKSKDYDSESPYQKSRMVPSNVDCGSCPTTHHRLSSWIHMGTARVVCAGCTCGSAGWVGVRGAGERGAVRVRAGATSIWHTCM